jgi:hypothetical protein
MASPNLEFLNSKNTPSHLYTEATVSNGQLACHMNSLVLQASQNRTKNEKKILREILFLEKKTNTNCIQKNPTEFTLFTVSIETFSLHDDVYF